MLPILLYITTVALLSLVVVHRAYEVALHPQNFHQIYEIPVINLYNQMQFPGAAASQPLTPPPPPPTVRNEPIMHRYPLVTANTTTGELPLGPAWYPAMHDPDPELLPIFRYYYQEHSSLVVALAFILAILCLAKYIYSSRVIKCLTKQQVQLIIVEEVEKQKGEHTKVALDNLLSTEIFNKIVLAGLQAIFDKFMQSLPLTSDFATKDDVNNSIASSFENLRAKFANGELRSIIQAETKNLVTKEDSLAIATSAIDQHGFATKENVIKDISQIKDGLEASINEKSAALSDSLAQQLASKDTMSAERVKEIVGLAVHDSEANALTREQAITSAVDYLTVKVLSQEVNASVVDR